MFSFCDHAKKKRYLGFKPVAALLIYGQVKAGEGGGRRGGWWLINFHILSGRIWKPHIEIKILSIPAKKAENPHQDIFCNLTKLCFLITINNALYMH